MSKLYYSLSEKEREILKDATKITCRDYDIHDDLVSLEELFNIIADLRDSYDTEIEYLEDRIQELSKEPSDYDPEREIPNIHYENMISG